MAHFLINVPSGDILAADATQQAGQPKCGFVIPAAFFVRELKPPCEKARDPVHLRRSADRIRPDGKMFAMEHFGVIPDILTMSKSIAAGIPVSAVTGRAEIMDAPGVGEIGGTFGGSPLGCMAALKVIEMLEEGKGRRDQRILFRFEKICRKHPVIRDVRGLGAMCAFEVVKDPSSKEPDRELAAQIVSECGCRGVAILGAGIYSNVVRILCSLVIYGRPTGGRIGRGGKGGGRTDKESRSGVMSSFPNENVQMHIG
jgi:4-aminobutyrate aminotransferase/(S)-3-amino-2-methylpropionate transaminase